MKNSLLDINSELEKCLKDIHRLANFIEVRNNEGLKQFRTWLLTTELVMKDLNLVQSSKLAIIRSQLGNFIAEPDGNKKKQIFHFASNQLHDSHSIIFEIFEKNNLKIQEAKVLILQLLSLIYQSQAFSFNKHDQFTSFIESIWKFCISHQQLKVLSFQVLGYISKSDAIRILANNIELDKLKK